MSRTKAKNQQEQDLCRSMCIDRTQRDLLDSPRLRGCVQQPSDGCHRRTNREVRKKLMSRMKTLRMTLILNRWQESPKDT
jgi:hypothetical protein